MTTKQTAAYNQLTNILRQIIHSELTGEARQQALDIIGNAKAEIARN